MPGADEYRRLAAEYLRLAADADTLSDFTGIFTALAQMWTNLADQLEGRPAGDAAPDDQG